MSPGEPPRALSIVADLDICTPAGDRLSLRADGSAVTLVATSIPALWRAWRAASPLLRAGLAQWPGSSMPVDVDVRVGDRVVARVEPSPSRRARVRLRWRALLRALFHRAA